MTTVTIAIPIGMTHPAISETAPIWVDATGQQYLVASGVGLDSTPVEGALIREGVPGLEALADMGLKIFDAEVIENAGTAILD